MSANFILKRNIEFFLISLHPLFSVIILIIMMLIVGCASHVSKGLLPELETRHAPEIQLGAELILLEEQPERCTSLIDLDGVAHLFFIDEDKRLNHLEILGDEIITREFLGVIETVNPWMPLDAVEHPRGKLRVIVGDRQYFRSYPNLKWQKVKGNRCARFVPVGDDLFCAFVIEGDEASAPERTDYIFGWCLLVPVFAWSHEHASKLVLAQESQDGWIVRVIVDPDSLLDAHGDFLVETDSLGNIHFLYFTSKGGGAFFIFAYYPGASAGIKEPESKLHYAQLTFDQLSAHCSNIENQSSRDNTSSMQWMTIEGVPLPNRPFIKKNINNRNAKIVLRPLNRNFSVNKETGEITGLMYASQCVLSDNERKFSLFSYDNLWVELNIIKKKLSPRFNIVTAKDFPTDNLNWFPWENLLIKADGKGRFHVLLESIKMGFWKNHLQMHYIMKDGINWSVPINLGSSHHANYGSTIAVDESGIAFAAWVNEEGNFIGRWIRPRSIGLK
jgi:hypothetical protein